MTGNEHGGSGALARMLRGMRPVLADEAYGFAVMAEPVEGAFATVNEAEGLTVIAPAALLPEGPLWARISLALHSDLAAVGLTAAFASALAAHGISANVVAGFHHDHIFVPWQQRFEAMTALQELSQNA